MEYHRSSDGVNPYRCERLDRAKDDEALRQAFLAHGFNPDGCARTEIGVYSEDYLRVCREREAGRDTGH